MKIQKILIKQKRISKKLEREIWKNRLKMIRITHEFDKLEDWKKQMEQKVIKITDEEFNKDLDSFKGNLIDKIVQFTINFFCLCGFLGFIYVAIILQK